MIEHKFETKRENLNKLFQKLIFEQKMETRIINLIKIRIFHSLKSRKMIGNCTDEGFFYEEIRILKLGLQYVFNADGGNFLSKIHIRCSLNIFFVILGLINIF